MRYGWYTIVSDMDGILLKSERELLEENKKAVETFVNEGIKTNNRGWKDIKLWYIWILLYCLVKGWNIILF